MNNNTDNELQRYEDAELYSATATPDMFSDIKSQFNTVTGQTDLLAPLPSGGFVRLASQAPDIMVEAPAMPGMGADAALPVEGPIARAAEQTALETEPATAEMRPSLAGRTEVVKEATKALISGAIVEPANFLKDNFGLYDPLAVQFVDPKTGEFDFKLHIMSREEKADLDAKMAAGELPYAMSLDDLVAPDKDASAVAGVAGGISQFLGAYLGIGKLFRVGSGFTGAMTQGAAADFLAFDGSDKAVTDMLLDMGWIEPNMITELLKKDPTDPDYVGRFQAAVEGAGLGAVIEKGLIPVLGLAFRAVKDKDVPVDAARQAIQQGKLIMQGALLKAGQNAELRIKERGTGTTLNMGGDPMALTDPLVAAAGRAVDGSKFTTSTEPADSFLSEDGVMKTYTDPKSGGFIKVLKEKDGSARVINFEVPEESRGKGIGQALQALAMKDSPILSGNVETKAAATTAYRMGRRPSGQPDATLDEVLDMIDTSRMVNLVSPAAQPNAAGRAVGDGKMSSKAQDAASKLSEEFGVDFNVSNHPTSYGNSTYVSGRIAGPKGTSVKVGFRLSDHGTGDKRKATDDFLTIIDDGEVTSETLVAEVQGQLDRALPKMQKRSDDQRLNAISQADALSRWSELSGDMRGEIAVKFKEMRPGYANNVPWKNLTKQQKADFAAREDLLGGGV